MTIENQQSDILSITVIDKDGEPLSYNVSAELVREYYGQAADMLRATKQATEEFKATVEAFSDATEIPKKHVSAFFKKRYEDAIKAASANAAVLSELNKAFD